MRSWLPRPTKTLGEIPEEERLLILKLGLCRQSCPEVGSTDPTHTTSTAGQVSSGNTQIAQSVSLKLLPRKNVRQ